MNTMPQKTLEAFNQHGAVEVRIDRDVDRRARAVPAAARAGRADRRADRRSSSRKAWRRSTKSYDELIEALEKRRRELHGGRTTELRFALGAARARGPRAPAPARRRDFPRRLWARDTSLWGADPAHHEVARHRLGWLDAIPAMEREAGNLKTFGRRVLDRGLHARGAARHGRIEPGPRGVLAHVRPRHRRPAAHGARQHLARVGARGHDVARSAHHAVHRLVQVRSDDRGGRRSRSTSSPGCARRSPRRRGARSSRSPIPRRRSRRWRRPAATAALSQPARHRRPLLGAVVLRPGAGGDRRHRPDARARARARRDARVGPRRHGRAEPDLRLRCGARRAGARRTRQGDARAHAGVGVASRPGSSSSWPRVSASSARAWSRSRASRSAARGIRR